MVGRYRLVSRSRLVSPRLSLPHNRLCVLLLEDTTYCVRSFDLLMVRDQRTIDYTFDVV